MAKIALKDPTQSADLKEIRERYEYATTEWQDIRKEAETDMQFVAGDPFTEEERAERSERPTIAPEEMSQYRNQVTNNLRSNPRGVKFQPKGNGASKRSAEFYQGKMREIEYRSHAVEAYVGAAENVLQRSYGYVRVGAKFLDPRSPNQELYIEGFPDPDVVLPDPDAKRRTSEDMNYCFVHETMPIREFKRTYKGAKVANFGDYVGRPLYKHWVPDAKTLRIGEYWSIEKRSRNLVAVVPRLADGTVAPKPLYVFEDEELDVVRRQLQRATASVASARTLHAVDFPEVFLQITNGLEILDERKWRGKYIPIVSFYGPILYKPTGGRVKKVILSMTRFGRDPWKAFCYASSQELEVLGMVPHGSVVAYEGQLAGFEDDWEEALHNPKLVLYAKHRIPGMSAEEGNLPLPTRLQYTQGEYLQAIQMSKEGFRRSIQAAMGSNFLPTQAQRINDKSGEALKKIDEAATIGTYHFVDAYEDGIRHVGVIGEDLIDKFYEYSGETGWMNAKLEASTVTINGDGEDSYPTRGDHLVTVTTAPSSDSEYDAVEAFLEVLVKNLQIVAQIAGPQVAAALLGFSIKMRNMGPMGDELADLVIPQQFKNEDGKPPDPRLLAAQAQIQQMQQELQKLGFVIQTKQIEGQTKFQIEKYKTDAKTSDADKDREVKLIIAELQAKVERMWLLMEGIRLVNESDGRRIENAHDAIERAKDRTHERHTIDAQARHAAGALMAGAAVDDAAADRDAANRRAEIDQQAGHARTLASDQATYAAQAAEAQP